MNDRMKSYLVENNDENVTFQDKKNENKIGVLNNSDLNTKLLKNFDKENEKRLEKDGLKSKRPLLKRVDKSRGKSNRRKWNLDKDFLDLTKDSVLKNNKNSVGSRPKREFYREIKSKKRKSPIRLYKDSGINTEKSLLSDNEIRDDEIFIFHERELTKNNLNEESRKEDCINKSFDYKSNLRKQNYNIQKGDKMPDQNNNERNPSEVFFNISDEDNLNSNLKSNSTSSCYFLNQKLSQNPKNIINYDENFNERGNLTFEINESHKNDGVNCSSFEEDSLLVSYINKWNKIHKKDLNNKIKKLSKEDEEKSNNLYRKLREKLLTNNLSRKNPSLKKIMHCIEKKYSKNKRNFSNKDKLIAETSCSSISEIFKFSCNEKINQSNNIKVSKIKENNNSAIVNSVRNLKPSYNLDKNKNKKQFKVDFNKLSTGKKIGYLKIILLFFCLLQKS